MKEPRIIRESETQKGVVYHYWPDGTLREIPYKDFTEENIGPCRICYERLAFIFFRIVRLVRHFKSIEVRKETDRMGHRKYITRWNAQRKVEPIDILIDSRNIRMGKGIRDRPSETKDSAESGNFLL